MRRAVISIPSNIAKGSKRGTQKDFKYFLTIAFGSGAELETKIELAKRLPFGCNLDYVKADILLVGCMKMLSTMVNITNS